MVLRYKKAEDFQDEETAKGRSENEVCIFTHGSSRMGSHRLAQQMRMPGEKASGKDCKGSKEGQWSKVKALQHLLLPLSMLKH